MRIVVYDTATGDILKTVLCPPSAADAQAGEGQAVIVPSPEGVTDTTHKVVDGEIVPL